MGYPSDDDIDGLRKIIRLKFLMRGWSNKDGYMKSVNDFDGKQKEKAKGWYSRSIVIHYPYFYNSKSVCFKPLDQLKYDANEINKMWDKSPEKMDRFVLEIIMDEIVEFIKKHEILEQVILFQHYGTYDYNTKEWVSKAREYHINVNGKIKKV